MDKNRIYIQFDSLIKFINGKNSYKSSEEELNYQRTLVTKILGNIDGSTRNFRDGLVKIDCYVKALVNLLSICSDTQVLLITLKIICEIIGKPSISSHRRAAFFMRAGATQTLLQVIRAESQASSSAAPDQTGGGSEEFMLMLHATLLRVSAKDRRLAVQARLSNCLGVLLNLLRVHVGNMNSSASRLKQSQGGTVAGSTHKTLFCLLQLLKLYSQNLNNCSRMGRAGVISILLRIVHNCHRSHVTILKIALSSLQLCVRTKTNASKAVTHGAVAMILELFQDLIRTDTKQKQQLLKKSLLTVIKSMIILRSGKKAMLEADGLHLLYNFCHDSIKHHDSSSNTSNDSLVTIASIVLRRCFPKNRLPLPHFDSVVRCPVPPQQPGSTMLLMLRECDVAGGSNRSASPVEMHPNSENTTTTTDLITAGSFYSFPKSTDKLDFVYPVHRTMRCSSSDNYEVDDEEEERVKKESDEIDEAESLFVSGVLKNTVTDDFVTSSYSKPDAHKNRIQGSTVPEAPNVNKRFNITTGGGSSRLIHSMVDVAELKREADQFQDSKFSVAAGDFDSNRQDKVSDKRSDEVQIGGGRCENNDDQDDEEDRVNNNDENDEEEDQLDQLISSLSMGGERSYKAPDDRPLSYLVQNYSHFIAERDFSTNNSSQTRNSQFQSRPSGDVSKKESESKDMSSFTARYIDTSSYVTRSLTKFSCIAYPDLFQDSCSSTHHTAPTNISTPPSAQNHQNHLLDDLRRLLDNEDLLENVVFDLDRIVMHDPDQYNLLNSVHSNTDEVELTNSCSKKCPAHLEFESQFECGNLRRAIQMRQYEYDLILSPDINTNHNVQWFYFRVTNMEPGIGYRFNIINCEKTNSQFNFGMQPLMYSVKENLYGRGKWTRVGSSISYFKNHFSRSAVTCGGVTGKTYYTCSFEIHFPHAGDACYLAYHYPYTYTRLLTDLHFWEKVMEPDIVRDEFQVDSNINETNVMNFSTSPQNKVLFSVQTLCCTILGNPVPLITITNQNGSNICSKKDETAAPSVPLSSVSAATTNSSKQYIFLTSRVHPGESNSSWLMRGCIEYLLGDSADARQLRDQFIFKIIPMLNPDGVINGNHRCSMAGHDLNRRWLNPCRETDPTIFHTKALLMLLTKLGCTPLVYCDLHGHSRKKGIFMYGCSSLQSWQSHDLCNPAYLDAKVEDCSYAMLPLLLSKIAPAVSLKNCSFSVEKVKESTGRVVVWRQFGVLRSYTVEASFSDYEHPDTNPTGSDNNTTNTSNTNSSSSSNCVGGRGGGGSGGHQQNFNMSVSVLQDTGAKLMQALLLLSQSLRALPDGHVPSELPDEVARLLRVEGRGQKLRGNRKASVQDESSSCSRGTKESGGAMDNGRQKKGKKVAHEQCDQDNDVKNLDENEDQEGHGEDNEDDDDEGEDDDTDEFADLKEYLEDIFDDDDDADERVEEEEEEEGAF